MPTIKNSLENKISGSWNKKLQLINWSAIISKIIYKQRCLKVCGIQAKKVFIQSFICFFKTSWIIDLFLELSGTCKKATSLDLKAILICNPTHSIQLFSISHFSSIVCTGRQLHRYHSMFIHQCSYHHQKFLLISADYSTSVIIIFILDMYSLPRILDQLYYNQHIEGRDVAGCYWLYANLWLIKAIIFT